MRKFIIFNLILSTLTFSSYTGKASFYGGRFHGKKTANGEIYDKYSMTCASNKHKFNTKLKVTNLRNKKYVICRVNNTGGFHKYGRVIDLSQGAFAKIERLEKGVIEVSIEVVK